MNTLSFTNEEIVMDSKNINPELCKRWHIGAETVEITKWKLHSQLK